MRYRDEFFVEPEVCFRILYGFIAMMCGSLIYDMREIVALSKYGYLFIIISILSCMGFLSTKFLIDRIALMIKLQFLTQVFGVTFAIFALMAGMFYEKKIQIFMRTVMGKILSVVSKCSLEVYLIQFPIISMLKPLMFPLNLVAILVCTITSAFFIHIVSEKIYSVLPITKKH